MKVMLFFFFFQAEDGIRDLYVTGVQTCALPILEAAARRYGSVLVVAGDWPGAQSRLLVTDVEWTGIGAGHGRLHARRAQVSASGRGAGERPRSAWLWLPGPDGTVTMAADRADVDAHPARFEAGRLASSG